MIMMSAIARRRVLSRCGDNCLLTLCIILTRLMHIVPNKVFLRSVKIA
jgi:hypothetical protein